MGARRTALVTGANRGLGLETARQLGRAGLEVIVASRDQSAGEHAAQTLRDEGLDARAYALDVTSESSVQTMASHVDRLDVLVNNAGVALDGLDTDVARRTLEVNVHGVRRVSEALLPALGGDGIIVNVSSGMGELACVSPQLRARFTDPGLSRASLFALLEEFVADVQAGQHRARGWPNSAYRVSKVALNAYTRLLAAEHPGLRINAVCPGWVRTAMGGPGASRSVPDGAASIVWAALLDGDGPTGGFFRDGHPIAW